jgi:hypothetical protein
MANGQAYEVRHPERAALAKCSFIIARLDTESFEACTLLHIAKPRVKGQVHPQS